MKKLIIAALAVTVATTMYAQGTVNMVSDKNSYATYGDSCAVLGLTPGDRIAADFVGTLMYEGQAVDHANFGLSGSGKNTGRLAGDLISSPLVPAGADVTFTLHAQNATGDMMGDSKPFTYTTGDANDPTKMPQAEMTFDQFTVEYSPIVPEPTTIALGILGLSSLLVLRRRD